MVHRMGHMAAQPILSWAYTQHAALQHRGPPPWVGSAVPPRDTVLPMPLATGEDGGSMPCLLSDLDGLIKSDGGQNQTMCTDCRLEVLPKIRVEKISFSGCFYSGKP